MIGSEYFRMPFGKHKGKLLSEIDDNYIDWLNSLDNLYEPTRKAVDAEWAKRHNGPSGAWTAGPRDSQPRIVQEAADILIQEGYRTLTRKWHPDVGGDVEKMKALNVAMDWIRRRIA